MDKSLKIKKDLLNAAEGSYEYLQIILEKYYELKEKTGDQWVGHFTDDQHCLLSYICLYDEVQNGGFIQLIWNGYTYYIFESPLIETLEEWGAKKTAELLEKIEPECNDLKEEIENIKNPDLNLFSKLYKKHPKFDKYDNEFYEADGLDEVKKYVEKHINSFIIIE